MLNKLPGFLYLFISIQVCISQPSNINISNGVLFDGEPYLVINPTNNNNLVAAWMGLKFSTGQLRIAIKTRASFDGGNNWSTTNTLPHFGNGFGSADVSMAFDKKGMLYISYIDYKQLPDSGGIYVARSVDGGINWDAPSKAFDMYDHPTKRPIDRPWLVVDNSNSANSGTLYITTKPAPWISPPNRNYFKFSTDSGHTWSAIATIDGGNHLIGNLIGAPMAAPATTINGNFCAIYPSYVTSQNLLPAYYFATSANRGQSFSYTTVFAAIPASNDTNLKNGYQLITHPTDNNKMIFFLPEAQNGDADIVAIQSNDGGQTWSNPIRVNDDTPFNGKSQDMVWGAYNENGNLVVTWRDRRNSNSNGFWNAGYDFYYATSSNNGQTFSKNQKLSNEFIAFDTLISENGNDFMSCVYRGDTLYSVWGDTRNGKMNIYFAKTIASTNTMVGTTLLDGEESQWQVFPNPANEEFSVSVPDEMIGKKMIMFDVNGKNVYDQIISHTQTIIKIQSFERGIYFLKIGNELKKIIRE